MTKRTEFHQIECDTIKWIAFVIAFTICLGMTYQFSYSMWGQ